MHGIGNIAAKRHYNPLLHTDSPKRTKAASRQSNPAPQHLPAAHPISLFQSSLQSAIWHHPFPPPTCLPVCPTSAPASSARGNRNVYLPQRSRQKRGATEMVGPCPSRTCPSRTLLLPWGKTRRAYVKPSGGNIESECMRACRHQSLAARAPQR